MQSLHNRLCCHLLYLRQPLEPICLNTFIEFVNDPYSDRFKIHPYFEKGLASYWMSFVGSCVIGAPQKSIMKIKRLLFLTDALVLTDF